MYFKRKAYNKLLEWKKKYSDVIPNVEQYVNSVSVRGAHHVQAVARNKGLINLRWSYRFAVRSSL